MWWRHEVSVPMMQTATLKSQYSRSAVHINSAPQQHGTWLAAPNMRCMCFVICAQSCSWYHVLLCVCTTVPHRIS